MKKITVKDITLIGIMAAAVYASSAFLQIPIPTAIGSTRLHMGNVMCLLSGMLLGATSGGLAAGIGSMFFDLTNPVYIMSAPFTFAFKFLMAWLCGNIISKSKAKLKLRFIGGGAAGAFLYVLLYISFCQLCPFLHLHQTFLPHACVTFSGISIPFFAKSHSPASPGCFVFRSLKPARTFFPQQ